MNVNCQKTNIKKDKQDFPYFTKKMKKTHTILISSMMPIHMEFLKAVLQSCGYKAEVLHNANDQAVETGLKYINNDMCYPAHIVTGELINALQTGNYDINHVAFIIMQSCGGCRFSNYFYLIRKALKKAGFGHIPVISFNLENLQKEQTGFVIYLDMMRKFSAATIYGDLLMYLQNKLLPYEVNEGDVAALVQKWIQHIKEQLKTGNAYSFSAMKDITTRLAREFAKIPTKKNPKTKVGIVGEIFMKFQPFTNNNLEKFLQNQNCEYMMFGFLTFIFYNIEGYITEYKLYGGNILAYYAGKLAMWYSRQLEKIMQNALAIVPGCSIHSYAETKKLVENIIGYGANMGEGWLLTAEMLELAKNGYNNIICIQPFGCLANHITGRGMINKIKSLVKDVNIIAIDYDAGTSKVNQENRIKLLLSTNKSV